MRTTTTAAFSLGRLLATPGALAAAGATGQTFLPFLGRHVRGDWGEVCDEDAAANERALGEGTRLLSAYRSGGRRHWGHDPRPAPLPCG